MNTIVRNALILLAVLVICVWAVYPPEKKIRLGKDVAGGVSLVYGVDIKPGDAPDTLTKVATNIHDRLDPGGALEISVIPMGGDNIEITMPLPSERVNNLKKAFEAQLAKVGTNAITRDELERVAQLPQDKRDEAVARLAAGDQSRIDNINKAILNYQAAVKARADYEPVARNVKFIEEQIKTAGGENSNDPVVAGLKEQLKAQKEKASQLVGPAAAAAQAYEDSIKAATTTGLNPADLRSALLLSNKPVKLTDRDGKVATSPSPRESALEDIYKAFPQKKGEIDASVAAWNAYESERTGLDDPQDVMRILRGAGVLTFRIAVKPGDLPNEQELRQQIRVGGPLAVKFDDAHFYKVNKIEQWVNTVEELEALNQSPGAFFANRRLVAEKYKGSYYVMCWDKPGMRLSDKEGQWGLAKAYQGVDQLGRPAIDFQMDTLGATKLGKLTGDHVQSQMAVLLDDEVYTAPTLQSAISHSGQITGTFSQPEIDYIVRVLTAGSLKNKLSETPLSQSIVGPTLGADNLRKSFETGIVAFALVASFMILYYFTSGFLAVLALIYNFVMVVAMMALNQSAFTLPGIAGVVLTFGQAVDANVLIYERMREEMQLGHDLKTSVRLGFSRALAPIVDGNISNLIICVVLGFFGTEEIRGFAITLGIGVVTTLFTTLFLTRFLFAVLIDKFGLRHTSQLPMRFPFVQRLIGPHVNWMSHRWVYLGILSAFLVFSGWVIYERGASLLGMEFRSGTAVTLTFKQTPGSDPQHPVQVTMTRAEVEARVKEIGTSAKQGSPLKDLEKPQVIAVNPDANDATKSGTFTIRSLVTDSQLIHDALVDKFADKLDVQRALKFDGSELKAERAPVFAISSPDIGADIERPGKGGTAPEFEGGAAILLDHIDPPVSKAEIDNRLTNTRRKPEFADIASRTVETRVLEGTDAAATSVVILVKDREITSEDRRLWESNIRDREWALIRAGLTESQMLASVQSFSPAIARTFATQGVVCTFLSLMLLTIYVFARFGTVRWAVAATLPLFADVIGIVGLIGMAQWLYENPSTQGFARAVGLLPFDLDLAQIAAILTIIGYSLNDKIIILDRIRENKGKMPYASARVINDSINQTMTRTVITAGAHMITTIALYCFGGEAVRGFAFTFNLGVLLGTYTSIVSTPLVWSSKSEPGAMSGSGLGSTSLPAAGAANGTHGTIAARAATGT